MSVLTSDANKSYEDITAILKRVSNRTLEMKTNNVKLLNKVGSEMNNLILKCQEIVRFCINDRNDFMKEIELIQFDFIELGRKIDEQFSSSSLENKPKTSQTQSTKSNLQQILNDSECSIINSDDEQVKPPVKSSHTGTNLNKNSNFGLVIPDTCYSFENVNTETNKEYNLANKRQLIIRDTIDSNNELFQNVNNENNRLETINENNESNNPSESSPKKKNLEETCLDEYEIEMPSNKPVSRVNYLVKNSQSTPLAVKKKLQEHGLLDLTNSPHESPYKSSILNSKQQNTNKQNQFSSPVKYIQSKFAFESPGPKVSNIKTPVKIVLKTPIKSPSLISKRPQFQQAPIDQNENEKTNSSLNEEQNDSLDFSFEFKKNSKNANQSSKANLPSQQNSKKQPAQKADLNETNSPSKNRAKRFKQLTMTQAFTSQSNDQSNKTLNSTTNSIKNKQNSTTNESSIQPRKQSSGFGQARKENDKNLNMPLVNIKKEFEETCLPNEYSDVQNIKPFRIKNEPATLEERNFNDETNFNVNDETSNDSNERRQRDLAEEYFNDFDKVPKKKNSNSPTFKHVQVVRKHDERKKLPTSTCRECETYWNSLPEDKRPKRMEESCRHRAKYQAPPTPEHYWSVAFPNTQECIERGYGGVIAQSDKDDQMGKRPRRKRPLKLIVNEDKNNENDDEIRDFDFGA